VAVRHDELTQEAVILRFPSQRAASRERRARMAARRRRAALVMAALVLSAALARAVATSDEGVRSRPGAPRVVVVATGESLWEVADRYAAAGVDPRAYVDALVALNAGDPGSPGDRIRLPDGAYESGGKP
jgi:hypothetical protein